MLKILSIVGAVAGAAGLSQFPEFSQQYLQRLAGKVDALGLVVVEFDATATANGLTRAAALGELTGTGFLDDRQTDMRRLIARYERLGGNLVALRAASPLARLAMPHKLGDAETLRETYADFRPAVPVTVDGAISAGIGYLAGWGLTAGLLSLLARPFRRRVA